MNAPIKAPHANNFGEHFTIDGYMCSKDLLDDRINVFHAINDLPELLGMKKLSTPEIYFAEGNNLKDPGGWTGFCVIEESHISVHTFPGIGFVSIDVYTCKNGLNTTEIENWFKQKFGIEILEVNLIQRGMRFSEFFKLYESK